MLAAARLQPYHSLRGVSKYAERVLPLVLRNGYASAPTFKAEKPETIKTLAIPIGVKEKPAITDNDGIDHRTKEQKKADFTDMSKNRVRREELKKEFTKSSFSPIYEFRDTGGKIFRGPSRPFGPKESMYMPNFRGITLDKVETGTWQYIGERPTVVRIFGSTLAEKQLDTFTDNIDFEALGITLLDLNIPTNIINEWLVKFSTGKLQQTLKGPFHKYMICRKGVTFEVRDTIAATNNLAGFLYILDKQGKIRWATAGPAEAGELELVTSLLSSGQL